MKKLIRRLLGRCTHCGGKLQHWWSYGVIYDGANCTKCGTYEGPVTSY